MNGLKARIFVLAATLVLIMAVPSAAAHHGDTDEHAEFPPVGPVVLYHQYTLLERELQDLKTRFPDYFKYEVIGKSVLGLNIYGVQVTNFKTTEPAIEKRPVIYFDGSIHSNEQLGMEAAMDIVYWLLEDYGKDPLAKMGVDTRNTYIVPMVNPDGNMRDSRRNVNDVDLNRNFPHGWGGPGSAARGDKPLSEPETQAIAKYLREKVRPHYVNSFHTGTLMLLHPYGNYSRDSKTVSPDHDLFTRICQGIQADMNKAAGRTVPCGQIYSTIYPASGSTVDFAYVEFGAIAFTFEVDNEQNLWVHPGDQASLRARLGETWAAVKHAYENVHRYGALLEIMEISQRIRDGKVVGLDLKIKNTGMAASNNAKVTLLNADGTPGTPIHISTPIEPEAVKTVRVPTPSGIVVGSSVQVQLSYNKTFFKGVGETTTVSLEAIKQGSNIVLRGSGAQPLSVAEEERGGVAAGFEGLLVVASIIGAIAVWRRKD